MTFQRRNDCVRAIKGYVSKLVPPGSFRDDCNTLIQALIDEVPDGIAVRKEIAGLLGLSPEAHNPEELSAWYALPNIRTAIAKLNGQLEEYKKLVEEAQAARAQDQQRLFHYEGALAAKGIDMGKLDEQLADVGWPEPAEVFKVGDRCIYDLGAGRNIPVKVIGLTPKRVKIKDIGEFGRIRYVSMRGLILDLNPSPE